MGEAVWAEATDGVGVAAAILFLWRTPAFPLKLRQGIKLLIIGH